MSSGRPPTLWCDLILAAVARARLDHVGVERALHEEAHAVAAARASSSKTRMNVSPMRLRFSSGSVDARERAEEALARVDVHERHLEVLAERLDDLLGLVLAQQAVVDEHARQLVADGAVHEQRRHRRVDAARQRADHALVADLRADARSTCSSITLQRRPVGGRLAGVGTGSSCSTSVPRGVCSDLGMELDGVEAARRRPPSPRPARPASRPSRGSPPGARTTASLWLIQHVVASGRSSNSTPPRVELQRRLAELGGARARRPRRRAPAAMACMP